MRIVAKAKTSSLRPVRIKVGSRAVTHAIETLERRTMLSAQVLQYHDDLTNSGVNPNETVLSPSNVNVNQFRKNFSTTVDGQIYAQPLYDPGVTITAPGQTGVHNVVFVATEHDSLYAIDADGGTILWHDSFIDKNTPGVALAGETSITTMPAADTKSTDINPEVGITGTPVIDGTTGMLYVAAKTKQMIAGLPHYAYTLYKVNIQDGSIAASTVVGDTTFNSGVGYGYNSTAAYVVGTGAGAVTVNGQKRVYFNAMRALNRGGLILQGGSVYMTTASHGDNGPYHGWMLGYDEGTLSATGVLNTTPNGTEGGVWMGGAGVSVDASGAFYFATGNGSFNTAASNFNAQGFPIDGNYGDADVKVVLDPTSNITNQNINGWGLKVADYFSPFNNGALNSVDKDLGSGGLLILPDSAGSAAHPHLLIGAGKEGKIYLVDRDNMGKFSATTDHVVQEQSGIVNGVYDTPAFFNGKLYYVGSLLNDTGKIFTVSNGAFATTASSHSPDTFGYPGSTPSISANGTTNGVIWDVDRSSNQLRAYDANNYGTELWTSAQDSARDSLGTADKFSVATPANGRVYVGTSTALVAYGPPLPATAKPAAPSSLAAQAVSGIEIDLTWQDNSNNESGFNIEMSTDGGKTFQPLASVGVNVTTYPVTDLTVGTSYSFRVYATNNIGNSDYSNTATTTTSAQTPSLDFSNGFANPGTLLQLNGNAKIVAAKLQLTDGTKNVQGSAFTTSKVDITNFSSQFTFQLPTSSADGFAFVLQNVSPTALGSGSQGLGYQNIKSSIAIKFDLYSNAGEGTNSTGLFTNGALPTVPATGMATSSINLHSGDVFLDSITYNGTTLKNTITDTKTKGTLTQTYTINLVSTIGSSTAYAGFTGGTGGLAALQNILTWTYTATPTTAPAAPSMLQIAAASGTQINLTWQDKSNNEAGFKILRGTDGTTFAQVGTAGANAETFMDGGLDSDQLYYYEVVATNGVGDSDPSNIQSLTTPVPPLTPSGVNATLLAPYEVTLSWTNNADNATGYQILREPTGESEFIPVGNLPAGSTSFDDLTVLPGVNYDYHIQCFNIAGYSDFAGINLTTPLAPPAVTATAGNQSVTLNWTVIDSADTYNVYRSTTPGGEGTTPYFEGTTSATTFTDTSLDNEQIYYYTVTSLNSIADESAQSAEVSATPGNLQPGPIGVKATANADGTIKVSWSPLAGAFQYNVYRSNISGQEGATPYEANVTNPFIIDNAITDLTQTYYYTVTAVSGAETAQSTEAAATPLFIAHVNFTHPTGGVVAGYIKDTGGKFPVTTGEYTYGWSINNTTNSRDRNVKGDPDELHDSLIHLDKQVPSATWSMDVPNGTYSVHLLSGDPSNFDSVYNMDINGNAIIRATPNSANRWFAGTINVTVTNGLLTISDGAGAVNGKVDSIDITSIQTPLNLSVVNGKAKATLTWNAVPGAVSYKIYRGLVSTGESLIAYASNITSTTFSDTAVTNGKSYFYEVTAVLPIGESVVSAEVKALPSATAAAIIATPAAIFSTEAVKVDRVVDDLESIVFL